MAQLASGVSLVTMHAEGHDHGFTATSLTSVSLDPMLVLVCVDRKQRSHALMQAAGHYGVVLLRAGQEDVGMRFASPPHEDRFEGRQVMRASTGAPLLADALAWLDCTIRHVHPAGDHSIFVGEVVACGTAEGTPCAPLLYYDRQWGSFLAG